MKFYKGQEMIPKVAAEAISMGYRCEPTQKWKIVALPPEPKHPPFKWQDGDIKTAHLPSSDWEGGVARNKNGDIRLVDPDNYPIGGGWVLEANSERCYEVSRKLGLDLDGDGRVQGKDLEDLRKLVAEHPPEPELSVEERLGEAMKFITDYVMYGKNFINTGIRPEYAWQAQQQDDIANNILRPAAEWLDRERRIREKGSG